MRFCLDNGHAPNRLPAHRHRESPNEAIDRNALRESPPPILVTNATMLEYMLVRAQDAPILQKSQGTLQWIVLDEAHSYIGSQAAELALLLRRVLHGFGVSADQVRFVATSATIGDTRGDTAKRLAEFLSSLAGIPVERVHVISGQREIPALLATGTGAPRYPSRVTGTDRSSRRIRAESLRCVKHEPYRVAVQERLRRGRRQKAGLATERAYPAGLWRGGGRRSERPQ